jgi:hypothetical protein
MKLEKKILKTLGDIDPLATYDITAHSLTRDWSGWSSNDRFRIATKVDLDRAVEVARGRWEVFKVNYNRKARVMDVEDACLEDCRGEIILEVACIPFIDIKVNYANWEVIVGNIGMIYDGNSYAEALRDYDRYVIQSISGYGRASDEDVTLMGNGEPYKEHYQQTK